MLAQSAAPTARTIPLASSKMLIEPVPGSPQKTNSLPMAIAISPDGRNVAVVNAGYGTAESKGEQSIAILDAKSHKLLDFPNPHTRQSALQTLYSGIAFGSDGQHLYVSIASLTHPLPDGKNAVGNGILVYRCVDGRVTEEKILPIPLQDLADGKRQNRMGAHPLPAGEANPYPSGLT
ncbi:MAG: phosphoesterase, partial [Acidobacteriaceae bacterium]